MPSRPCSCCRLYWNIEKLNKNTGAIMWREEVPINVLGHQNYNLEIRALSDGSFVCQSAVFAVTSGQCGLQRLSSDGLTVIGSTTIDSPPDAFRRRLAIKPGGGSPITDRIYSAGSNDLTCYDGDFNVVWNVNTAFNSAFYYSGDIYCANAADNRLYTFDASTGVAGIAGTLFTTGAPLFTPVTITIKAVDASGIYSGSHGNSIQQFPLTGGARTSNVGGGTLALDGLGNCYSPIGLSGGDYKFASRDTTAFATNWTGVLGDISITPKVISVELLADGGVVAAGCNGKLPVCDNDPSVLAPRELKNVWCFNSDGSLRWTNKQSDEVQSYSFPPDSSWAPGAKYGLTIAADGHVVVSGTTIRRRPRYNPCYGRQGSSPSCHDAFCSFKVTGLPGSYTWANDAVCSECGCPYTTGTATSTFGPPTGARDVLEFFCQ